MATEAVTEAEWLTCTDPLPMLAALRDAGKTSERKLRLFAVACCQQAWQSLQPDWSRPVEAAERYADGLVGREVLSAARHSALAALEAIHQAEQIHQLGLAPCGDFDQAGDAWAAAAAVRACTADFLWHALGELGQSDAVFGGSKPGLLRDIFGNPFRANPSINPTWLTWNAGTVVRLATAVYEERALPLGELDRARLAVLADALEDAGCEDPDILGHLRGPGPHVRGCWAVDLILGMQ
jgi:hypothetical protein